jgi:hypothetical protein
MTQAFAFLGPAELGLRQPEQVVRVVDLAHRAGLQAKAMRVHRSDPPGSPGPDAFAVGLANILAATGVAAEVRNHPTDSGASSSESPSPDAIARAAADPTAVSLDLAGDGWALSLPLRPGLATGAARQLDPANETALRMLFGLFDACLADWAVAGPHDHIATCIAGYANATGPGASSPPVGRFTWRGPDLLTDIEALGTAALSDVDLHRSATGAVVLLCKPECDPDSLKLRLPPLAESWDRPPIRWLAVPGQDPAPLRPASAKLQRRQQSFASRVADRIGLPPDAPAAVSVLEAATKPDALNPQAREEISAFVGEAARDLGGSWLRLLSSAVPFPTSLLVLLGDKVPFYPHACVERWCQGGVAPSIALETARRMLVS